MEDDHDTSPTRHILPMREATDKNVQCGTATTSKKMQTVTPALFYKRGRAVPVKAVASVHSFRQPKVEILELEEAIVQHPNIKIAGGNVTLATDSSSSSSIKKSTLLHPSRHQTERAAEVEKIPLSPTLEGLDLGGVNFNLEDEGQLQQYQDDDESPPYSPLLFESSPSKRVSSLPSFVRSPVLHNPPSRSSSCTATIVRPPSASGTTEAAHSQQPEEVIVLSSPRSGSLRRSKIWEHFVSVGDGRLAKCKLCGREVSRGRTLGHLTNAGMNNHFRTHHTPVLLREESGVAAPPSKKRGSSSTTPAITTKGQGDQGTPPEADIRHPIPIQKQQPTLQQFTGFQSRGMSRQQCRKITRLIGQLIAVGGAPFNIVEGEPFKQLMQAVAPHYNVPCRTTFSRKIVPSLYNSCVELLKEELGRAAGQSVHFTTDLWSAPSGQHAFLSLTAHWWQPSESQSQKIKQKSGARSTGAGAAGTLNQGHCTFLLHAEVMDEQHSAQNIVQALKKMVAEWLGEEAGTRPKMGFLVTDGASNMLKAVRDGRFVGIRCSAHVLHLVVKAAVDDESSSRKLSAILDSCRKIAGHFHRSVKDSHILRREQSKAGIPQHRLKIDVGTPWNSTLEMLERILEQQKPIHAMSHEHVIGVARPLSREEWTIISQMVTVLSPFRAVTENLSQGNASLAQVLPLFAYLDNKMDGFLNNTEPLPGGIVADVAALINRLKAQLIRRSNELTETCPELMLASMCDPRIKGKMALLRTSLTTYRDLLIKRVCDRHSTLFMPLEGDEEEEQEESADSDIVPPSPTNITTTTTAAHSTRAAEVWTAALNCLVGPTRLAPTKQSQVYDHVKAYLSEPHLPSTTEPLEYWDEKRSIWPALSMVAQELLSCPPTSVQSERIFSITGNILCPQRSQLSPQLMEQMAFLKVNIPKLGYPALSFETE